MDHRDLFSRRNVEPDTKTDFRPDNPQGTSPFAQLRRLKSYLETNTAPVQDITDCDEGIGYLREFVYRKTFTGCTHEQYLETDANDPTAIDWLLAVAAIENASFAHKRNK